MRPSPFCGGGFFLHKFNKCDILNMCAENGIVYRHRWSIMSNTIKRYPATGTR